MTRGGGDGTHTHAYAQRRRRAQRRGSGTHGGALAASRGKALEGRPPWPRM